MEGDQPQPVTPPTPAEERIINLRGLQANLRVAKRQEESVKANRIALEEMIAKLIPGKEVGQVTERFSDGSGIVVTRGLNYRADLEGLKSIWADSELPIGGLMAPIESKTTWGLDVKGYEWYKEHHPKVFQQLAKHVTVTPKKVSVVLKDPKGE